MQKKGIKKNAIKSSRWIIVTKSTLVFFSFTDGWMYFHKCSANNALAYREPHVNREPIRHPLLYAYGRTLPSKREAWERERKIFVTAHTFTSLHFPIKYLYFFLHILHCLTDWLPGRKKFIPHCKCIAVVKKVKKKKQERKLSKGLFVFVFGCMLAYVSVTAHKAYFVLLTLSRIALRCCFFFFFVLVQCYSSILPFHRKLEVLCHFAHKYFISFEDCQ